MTANGATFGLTTVAHNGAPPSATVQTTNYNGLVAMANYMISNAGAKVDLSDLNGDCYYNQQVVFSLPTSGGDFHLDGQHACVLRGPGFKIDASAVPSGQHIDCRGIIENLTFNGKEYTAAGSIGIDVLRPNGITIQHCVVNGFYDAIVIDQVQDSLIINNEIRNFTRSGIFLPAGGEIHVGISPTQVSRSNVCTILANHINGSSTTVDDYGVIDHGGLQHTIQGNQISNCKTGVRVGNVTDCIIRTNDIEAFGVSGALALRCVNTNLAATPETIGYPSKLTISDGNYVDAQIDLGDATAGAFSVMVQNNRFRPGSSATSVFLHTSAVRNLWSLGNEAVDSNGVSTSRVYDGVPSGLLFQVDIERFNGANVAAVNVPPNNLP